MDHHSKPLKSTYPVKDITWSLNPFVTWMWILGVDLNWSASRNHTIFALISSCLFLFLNIYVHISFLCSTWEHLNQILNAYSASKSLASSVNVFIEHSTYTLNSISSQLCLLFMCKSRWLSVYRSIQSTECQQKVTDSDCVQLRKLTIAGLCYILVIVSYYKWSKGLFLMNLILENFALRNYCLLQQVRNRINRDIHISFNERRLASTVPNQRPDFV